MACGARGVFTKFCVEPGSSPHTFDNNSEPYKFDVLTIGRKTTMVIQNDITGTRSFPTEQVRQGPYIAMGDVRMRLSAGIFDLWAPRILGGTLSGGIVDVADALPSFGCLASKAVDTEQLKDCVVARGIYSRQGRRPCRMSGVSAGGRAATPEPYHGATTPGRSPSGSNPAGSRAADARGHG